MSPLKDMRWNCIQPGVATGFMRSGSVWTMTRFPPYFGCPHPTPGLSQVASSQKARVRSIIHQGFAKRMRLPSLYSHNRGVRAQLLHTEVIQPRRVRARDLDLLGLRHPLENAVDNGARPGKSRLGMWIVRGPQQSLDPNVRSQLDTQGIFLKAQEDVVSEEIAREYVVFEQSPADPKSA